MFDDSWFDLSTDYESIWALSGDTSPEREIKMINSPKIMLTIVWNPHGFHVIDIFPKGCKFNSNYYISHILDAVS
jgi:hypothetical protein